MDRYCLNCGTLVPGEFSFCGNCGSQVPNVGKKRLSGGKIALIVLGAILAAVAAGVGLFLLLNGGKQPTQEEYEPSGKIEAETEKESVINAIDISTGYDYSDEYGSFEYVTITAWDKKGNEVWSYRDKCEAVQLESFHAKAFSKEVVVVHNSINEILTVLDYETGETISTAHEVRAGMYIDYHDGIVYVPCNEGLDGSGYFVLGCQAIRASDGACLWEFNEWDLDLLDDEMMLWDINATDECVVLTVKPYFQEGSTVEIYLSHDGEYLGYETIE